jgi:hypothetical protein
MDTLPERDNQRILKLAGHFRNDNDNECLAAVRAANRILDAHKLRWCEIISPQLPQPFVKRQHEPRTWRETCAELTNRRGSLNAWEVRFVSGLPGFRAISPKQRRILDEIALRVLGRDE